MAEAKGPSYGDDQDRYIKSRFLVRALKQRHWQDLGRDRNVVGAAFGRRVAHGEVTNEPAMVIYVMKKVPNRSIPPSGLRRGAFHARPA